MKEGKRREEMEKRRRQAKYAMKNQGQGRPVDSSIHSAPPMHFSQPRNPKPTAQRIPSYEHGSISHHTQQHPLPLMVQQQKYSVPPQSFFVPTPPVQQKVNRIAPPVVPPHHNTSHTIASPHMMTPPQPRTPITPTQYQVSQNRVSSATSVASTESLQDQQDNQIATQLFQNHDVKNVGRLTADELQNLLQNDDGTKFCATSIGALINIFGGSRIGTVNLTEFVSLYKRVKKWRKCFVDNDKNGSFTLTMAEFHNALQSLGYVIPFEVSEKLFEHYGECIEYGGGNQELKFDRFVETLVWLMRLTKVFRKYDKNQEGVATIEYKDFIDISLFLGRFLPHQ